MLTPDFGNLLGDTVNGTLSLASWNWDLPYEGIEDVNERYMEKHDVPFMSHEAGQSYAAVWLIAEAMEQAGSSEPEDIAEVLRGIDISEGPGAWMPGNHVSFDETGRNEGVYTILIQWQDGVTRTVWPEDVATVEPL
jgi:branched-chain amino acid transport system substrate-binding protein